MNSNLTWNILKLTNFSKIWFQTMKVFLQSHFWTDILIIVLNELSMWNFWWILILKNDILIQTLNFLKSLYLCLMSIWNDTFMSLNKRSRIMKIYSSSCLQMMLTLQIDTSIRSNSLIWCRFYVSWINQEI